MAKTIKIEDHVAERLSLFKQKDETWNTAVDRVLSVAEMLYEAKEILGPNHFIMKRPRWLGED